MIKLLLFIFSITLFTGCSTLPDSDNTPKIASAQNRDQQMLALTHWAIKGKIAFIEQQLGKKKKRQSADLSWRYHISAQGLEQSIDLTTFLGINVLHIESQHNKHTVKVDGKSYHTDDLSLLIYQLTGLTLPVEALHYWLKAIPYNKQDTVYFNNTTHLPEQLTNRQWKINYQAYQNVNGYLLPKKINILHNNMQIKIYINQWKI